MKKSTKLLTSLPMLCAIALSSCGGSRGDVEVDRTLPADDPTSEVSFDFWHCLGHEKATNLEKIATKFNTEWAGRYKVNLVKLAGDYDGLHDVVKTKLADGAVPGLCMGYPDSFAEYMTDNIKQSFILRINNFIGDANFGYSATELKDFVQKYYNEGSVYQHSGVWSMPMYKSTEVVYYNANYFAGDNNQNLRFMAKITGEKKTAWDNAYAVIQAHPAKATDAELTALRKAAVDAGSKYVYDMPTKWDDLIAFSNQILADRKEQSCIDEFYPFGYDSDANLMISQFAQRGIDYTVNNDATASDPTKHFVFNNTKAKAFATEVVNLLKNKNMITKNSLGGTKYTNSYFNDGKLALTVGSTGGSSYNISASFTVKLAPVPYYGTEAKYIQQGPSICFFNNDNDYVHKGAWLFYKYMADPAANCSLALENSYDPIRVSSYETEEYRNWIALAGKGLKYDIPNITRTLKDYYMTSPTFIGSSTARKEIGNIISYMYSNGNSADVAFEKAYNVCCAAVSK